jgi:4-amino-4-deoxy-L-arabinose transferase-like glycosyltransferase
MLALILCCSLVFLALSYRVQTNALFSWDEAWYADITRSLVRSRNPLRLEFNGSVFTDHPPFGFMLMAIPTFLLGSNELSTRILSVVLGTATAAILILIGKELKSPASGFGAIAILMSSLWFVLRARTGNLDVPFIFWETLTVYLALRVKHSPRSFIWLTLSFCALFLTKTLIGFAILPVVFLILWPVRTKISRRQYALAFAVALICITPWYLAQSVSEIGFLQHHFVEIGARGDSNSVGLTAIAKNLMYIRSGIGKWFYVFWASLALSLVAGIAFPKHRRNLLILLTWTASFGLPFFLSSSAEIWHFLPVYPAAALLISYTLTVWSKWATQRVLPHWPRLQYAWLLGVLLIALWQFRAISSLVYPVENPVSTEKEIAIMARDYPRLVLLDTFYPALRYYSESTVEYLFIEPNAFEQMLARLQTQQPDVFVIPNSMLTDITSRNVAFVTLDQNSTYAIIQAPQEKK